MIKLNPLNYNLIDDYIDQEISELNNDIIQIKNIEDINMNKFIGSSVNNDDSNKSENDNIDRQSSNNEIDKKELEYVKKYDKDKYDNNIMLELIDKSIDPINNSIPSSKEKEQQDDDIDTSNSVILSKNINNVNITRLINKNYWIIDDNHYEIPQYNYIKSLFGDRNIYMLNNDRGTYRSLYEDAYINDKGKINCTKLIHSPIFLNYPYISVDHYELNRYNYARKIDYLCAKEPCYIKDSCNKYHHKNNKNCKENIFSIYKIPKDLMNMFARITKYWKEIKSQLFLNKETGYYCYKVSDKNVVSQGTNDKVNMVPIICKHQAMILDNIDVNDIAKECYINGVCKYCGQELIAYNDVAEFVLPPSAMTLIIQFAESFKKSYSTDNIIYAVNEYIAKKIEKEGISVYSTNECVGYTSLFLIKLCMLVKENNFDIIEYKIKALLNKLSKHLAYLGKSEQDIKDALDNVTLFEDIHNFISILKTTGITSSITQNSDKKQLLIEDILFNGLDRKAKNGIQKLYNEDKSKMFETQLALKSLVNALYNTDIDIKDIKEELDLIYDTIKSTINDNGYNFFNKSAKYYCPINFYHEFSNNKCVHCGINENMKNIEEVYNKYYDIINNISIEEPVVINENINKDYDNKVKKNINEIDKIIEDIKNTDETLYKNIIKKYIEYTDIIKVEDNFKLKNKQYFKDLSIILNIPYEYIYNEFSGKDIKKIIIYIIDNNIQDEETAINNMLVYYLNTEDPRKLLTTIDK